MPGTPNDVVLNREHHLKFCTVCKKRQTDPGKGMLCSLTGDYAAFDRECRDFEFDAKEQEKFNKEKNFRTLYGSSNREYFEAQERLEEKGKGAKMVSLIGGIVLLICALILLILNLDMGADGIRLITPLILMVSSIILIVRGATK